MRQLTFVTALALFAGACVESNDSLVPRPENLYFELEPSGEQDEPQGIKLVWDEVVSPDLQAYRVYSRPGTSGDFGLRGETTSSTFHDRGIPDLEYFVVAVDVEGRESLESNHVTVDTRLALEAPATLVGTTLNGAVHLAWSDNAYTSEPDYFQIYRVYSSAYSLDDGLCGETWYLEGTTVAPEFLASALTNGSGYCFGITAVSLEGYESLWSPIWADFPRPDARNVVMTAFEADATQSGFRFWQDTNGDGQVGALELGLVADGSRVDLDFRVTRDGSNNFFLLPVRAGTGVQLYAADPVDDLTTIDYAPESGYATAALQARPGYGYVFEMSAGDAFARYGAIRVTHVGATYLIFDWSYQTDPGNPELSVGGGVLTAGTGGLVVHR
jgi:hypothetical protein